MSKLIDVVLDRAQHYPSRSADDVDPNDTTTTPQPPPSNASQRLGIHVPLEPIQPDPAPMCWDNVCFEPVYSPRLHWLRLLTDGTVAAAVLLSRCATQMVRPHSSAHIKPQRNA